MHILEVIDSLTVGGAEKMVLVLARLLTERHIPFSVVSFDTDWDTPYAVEIRKLGVPVHHFTGKLFNVCRMERLTRLMHETGADVVHTYLSYANIVGTICGKLAHVPVVTSLRSISLEPYHPVRSRIETWLMRHCCNMVMANGYSVAQAHQARLGREIQVIQNSVGVGPGLSPREREKVRAELTGNPEKTIIISVGRLAPPKGYDTLIEAFAQVHTNHPETALVIVGDGQLRKQLEEVIAAKSLQRSVLLTGERDDIARILPAADIYASSSYWEGMSVAILEAMAAGLPVVATRVGDAPWVLTEQTGILVAPRQPQELAKALAELVEDKPARLEFGENARKRIESEYSLDQWCDKMLDLYARVNPAIKAAYA